jgi:hypothetical protein
MWFIDKRTGERSSRNYRMRVCPNVPTDFLSFSIGQTVTCQNLSGYVMPRSFVYLRFVSSPATACLPAPLRAHSAILTWKELHPSVLGETAIMAI